MARGEQPRENSLNIYILLHCIEVCALDDLYGSVVSDAVIQSLLQAIGNVVFVCV